MFGHRVRLFRLLGIPIYVDASWLVILALLTLSLAGGFPAMLHAYFPRATHEPSQVEYWMMGLITALAFFTCIVLHELGHAVVARARGMPIRGITLFLFGGVAELGDEPDSARTEFLTAVGGPAVSVVLALAFGLMAALGRALGWPYPVVIVLGYLATINAIVLVFNLVPAYPLDGGRVLRSLLWGASGDLRRATYWAAMAGRAFATLLIILGVMQLFTANWLGGIWMSMIGLFLNSAAQGSYMQVLLRQALRGEPVRRFMNPNPRVVTPSLRLDEWVEEHVYRYHHRAFPVVDDGRVRGCIEVGAVASVPRGDWAAHTVGQLMRTDLEALTVSPDTDALDALGKMQKSSVGYLLVVDGDRLVGLVGLRDLMGFLSLKLELEGEARERSPLGLSLDRSLPDRNRRLD
jgi:Zn-dependent protease/CBS domain-containing protein